MTPTNWTPGIVVGLVGLAGSVLFLLLQRGKAPDPGKKVKRSKDPSARADALLEHDLRVQAAIDQLKEHLAERHHLTAERFEARKAELERAAANAMRARDLFVAGAPAEASGGAAAVAAERPVPGASGRGFLARHPELKGALWGGAVVLFFAFLGLTLFREEAPRTEGGTMTGKDPNAGRAPPPPPSPPSGQLEEAITRAETNPEDLENASAVVHELLRTGDVAQAAAINARTLAQDPFHVESRIHGAMLRALRGDTTGSAAELERLADVYPGAHEALIFLGALRMDLGQPDEALRAFERFRVEAPADEQSPQIDGAIQQLRAQLGR